MSRGKLPTPTFCWRRERVGVCMQCFSFLRGCLRDWLRSFLFQRADRTRYTPDAWAPWTSENKKARSLAPAPEDLRNSRQRLIQLGSLSIGWAVRWSGNSGEWIQYFDFFRVLYEGLVCVLPNRWDLTYSGCLGTENKKEVGSLWQCQETCSTKDRHWG